MIKDLQKQIEEQKRQVLQPLKEKIETVLEKAEVDVNINDAMDQINLSILSKEKNRSIVMEFVISKKSQMMSCLGTDFTNVGNIMTGLTAVPVVLDINLVLYILNLSIQLIDELNPVEDAAETPETPQA